MEKKNFQIIMDKKLEQIKKDGEAPLLLLHSCCAPCSCYVLEYLVKYFNINLLFYNPNIMPENEYSHRLSEQKRLVSLMDAENHIEVIEGRYDINEFTSIVKGLEGEPEGGARCEKCFILRLEEAAVFAKNTGADYFTTTLTVSPHKNAQLINQLGMQIGEKYGVNYLEADFKKRNGYKRSIELSGEYGLYRQNYCGCSYSSGKR
jgi:predicted adenine nucleotide alpha hydrolase (AANH) superfamily ATPase